MKKLAKSFFVTVLALTAILSFCLVINFNTAKTTVADSTTETLLANTDFSMQSDAEVRIKLVDDGNGGLVATDYNDNGIRFTAVMPKAEYESLENSDNGVGKKMVFGILVMPKDYLGETPITANDVFGESGAFTTSATDTAKTRVAFVETNVLKDGGDYYYMQASMVKLLSDNKDREFIGIPYLKAMDGIGFLTYKIKDYSLENANSMAYIAQKEYEKNDTNALIKTALKSFYIDGLTADLDVAYIVSYDGLNGVAETKTVTFDLNAEITAADVRAKIDAVVDGNVVEYGGIGLRKNNETVTSMKIYANGKNDTEVTANYNVKESEDYSEVQGYYITGDNSVVLGDNNGLLGNADYANGNSTVNGNYKLYVDDTIKIDYDDNSYFATFAADGFEFGGDYYTPSITVPNAVYRNVRGYYVNGANFVVLNELGGVSKNLTDTGNYIIYFDKESLNFKISVSMVSQITDAVINLGSPSVTVGGAAYSLSGDKTLATMEQYAAFANAYKGDYYFPNSTKADGNWDTNAYAIPTTMKTPQTTFTFSKDGTAVYDGIEIYRYTNWLQQSYSGRYLGEIVGKKAGGYVLFDDGTFKVLMRDIAVRKQDTTLDGRVSYIENVIIDGSFDNTDADSPAVTINFTENYKKYLSELVLTADAASTETVDTDGIVDLDALYEEFCTPVEGYHNVYQLRTDIAEWNNYNAMFTFKTDGTFRMVHNANSKTGTYELTPINANYGKIKLNFKRDGAPPAWLEEGNGYYSYIDGRYKLRINFKGVTPVGCFSDLRVAWGDISGSGISNDTVTPQALAYNPLVGAGGTVENPATRTFTSTANDTLVLKNDGTLIVDKPNGTTALCGRGVYTPNGEEGQDLLYSLVPTSRKGGLIFMYLSDTTTLTLDDESKYIVGEYVMSGAYLGIICDLGIFTVDNSDLYTEYAGTYHADYTVKNTDYDMTIVLNSDGTFRGYSEIYSGSDTSCWGPITYYQYCLGPNDRTGVYYFEVINGELKIILDFKVHFTAADSVVEGGETVEGPSLRSGYCSRLIYGQNWGSSVAVSNGVPSEYVSVSVLKVYDFATGTLGNNSISVLFEAFSSTPITLNKTTA